LRIASYDRIVLYYKFDNNNNNYYYYTYGKATCINFRCICRGNI